MARRKSATFDPAVFLATSGVGRKIAASSKNQRIFKQGDRANSVFYIQKGKVSLTVRSRHGQETIVSLLGSKEFFGEGCLAGESLRMTSATADSPCTLLEIEKDAMMKVISEQPSFLQFFVAHLLTRNARYQENLADLLFSASERRLARLLLVLSQVGKEAGPEPVIHKINHRMLAEMTGTTPSRVNAYMKKFKKLGMIDYHGGLRVHPSLVNVVLAG